MNEASSRAAPILAAITAAALYYVRSFDAFAHPQFWAEDGNLLWLQQYLHGPRVIFLPYAGYLYQRRERMTRGGSRIAKSLNR